MAPIENQVMSATEPTQEFLTRCREITAPSITAVEQPGCTESPELSDADSLIGVFQHFRPDGEGLPELFDGLPIGDQLVERLELIYEYAGDNRRPAGGRDAYFIVRSPKKLTVEAAEHHGETWLNGLREIANAVGDTATAERLAQLPRMRVLEGIPPKHPKRDEERSGLLKVLLNNARNLTGAVSGVDPHAALLRSAYYFIACDHMLRDYLMWPFFAKQTGLTDPLRSYFRLWSHGVKYRTFREDQLDLYLPREAQ